MIENLGKIWGNWNLGEILGELKIWGSETCGENSNFGGGGLEFMGK